MEEYSSGVAEATSREFGRICMNSGSGSALSVQRSDSIEELLFSLEQGDQLPWARSMGRCICVSDLRQVRSSSDFDMVNTNLEIIYSDFENA